LFAFLFGKTDFRAYLQLVERTIEHAVAVKINFAAVGSLEKTIAELGLDASDPSEPGWVRLYRAALFARVVFELPAGGVASIRSCSSSLQPLAVWRRM